MSGSILASSSIEPVAAAHVSPGRRAWRRFRKNKLGFRSLVVFSVLVILSLFAEVLSNDRPLLVHFNGEFYFPMLRDYPEKVFGGDWASVA